jgi:hypothetical protein
MSRTKPVAGYAPYQLQGSKVSQWSSIDRAACEEELEEDHLDYYLSEQKRNELANDNTLSDHDRMIIQYLACRKFHIPGNSFWEDYSYWYDVLLCRVLQRPDILVLRLSSVHLLTLTVYMLTGTAIITPFFVFASQIPVIR